jgi:hypothetical protein
MTTRQKLIAGTVLVLVVGAVYYIWKIRQDDEPPIRVHNGSIQMDAGTGAKFKGEPGDADDSEASYSHETTAKNSSKDVYASISPTTSCAGNLTQARNEIVVTYHVDVPTDDHAFTFKRGRINGVYATKIRPVKDVQETPTTPNPPTTLTYGAGVSGHISKVDLRGQGQAASCTFTAKDKDVKIAICASTPCRYN